MSCLLHPRKPTWNLKITALSKKHHLPNLLFFGGGGSWYNLPVMDSTPLKKMLVKMGLAQIVVNIKHIRKHHPEDYVWKQPWFFSEVEDLKNRFSRQTWISREERIWLSNHQRALKDANLWWMQRNSSTAQYMIGDFKAMKLPQGCE